VKEIVKKYWPYAAIVVLLGCMSMYQHCLNVKNAEFLGELAKNKVIAENNAKLAAVNVKYKKDNAKLQADIDILSGHITKIGDEAEGYLDVAEQRRKEILKLKDYKVQAEKLNLELIASNGYVLKLKRDYTTEIGNLNLKWGKLLKNKNDEISDLTALYGALNVKYGESVKGLVKAKLMGKRRLIIGPTAGICINGSWFAGFGITFKLFTVPLGLF
jgi:hypothetical protein